MNIRLRLASVALLTLAGAPAVAHTSLPASLILTEVAPGSFNVDWRVPTADGTGPSLSPVLPSECEAPADSSEVAAPASVVVRGVVACGAAGLDGQPIEIAGLTSATVDVLFRVMFLDGSSLTRVLNAQAPSVVVVHQGARGNGDILGYGRLGVTHILTGLDHLMFVVGLLLIVSGIGRLARAITAFTIAHSVTLGLATLGVVRIATTPVEAVIALSILFLAVEMLQYRRGIEGLAYRKPWMVAFAFGLLHGLGFAGTLTQIGIPRGDVPLALLGFNAGVEAGQLGFVAVVLAGVCAWRTLNVKLPDALTRVPAYTLGSFAAFWFLQRCALIFGRYAP